MLKFLFPTDVSPQCFNLSPARFVVWSEPKAMSRRCPRSGQGRPPTPAPAASEQSRANHKDNGRLRNPRNRCNDAAGHGVEGSGLVQESPGLSRFAYTRQYPFMSSRFKNLLIIIFPQIDLSLMFRKHSLSETGAQNNWQDLYAGGLLR